MERKCTSCGARISDGMKICANCGKVISPLDGAPHRRTNPNRTASRTSGRVAVDSRRSPQRQSVQNRQGHSSREMTQRYPMQDIPQERRSRRQITQQRAVQHKPKKTDTKREKDKKSIGRYIKIAVVILIIYAVVSIVQIFRVRLSAYNFKTEMKMTYSNYGQAADNFFDSSFWVYNPFTFTVRLSGTASNGNEYVIKYSAFTSVKVKSITVDDEEKTDKQIETEIMGLFI